MGGYILQSHGGGYMTSTSMTRATFTVPRAAEFFSEKELQMQMGASRSYWLPMLLKGQRVELNAMTAPQFVEFIHLGFGQGDLNFTYLY